MRALRHLQGRRPLLAAIAGALLWSAPPLHAAKAPRAPAVGGSCTARGCHATLVQPPNLHADIEAEGCTGCHSGSAPAADTQARCKSGEVFALSSAEPDLCLNCHDVQKATPLHAAIEAGGCTACHDPHASKAAKLLKEDSVNALCQQCHPEGTGSRVHPVLLAGSCLDCHDPHSGAVAPLLKKPASELCADCHDVAPAADARSKHAPVQSAQCTICHDPHQGAAPALLRKKPNELCLSCHDAKATAATASTRRISIETPAPHAAAKSGSCIDCHVGHASRYQRLLRKPQPQLCYGCHERQDRQPVVHSALLLGQCSTCHDPHGGQRAPLMRFATTNEMCFACHADDMTGRGNLHNPAETDCEQCHQPHGGNFPALLKAEGKAVCHECHQAVDEGKVKHLVLERQGCTACHDPHATAQRSFLAKPVNELCAGCHPKQADGRHVPTSRPEGHIVTGPIDPKRSGRAFSCASCHDPHGSDFPKLLYQGGEGFAVCARCHFTGPGGQTAAIPGQPPPLGNLIVHPSSSPVAPAASVAVPR